MTDLPTEPMTSAACALRAERLIEAAHDAYSRHNGRDAAAHNLQAAALWAELAQAAAIREQTHTIRNTR